jgi:hypothetical protein
MRVLTDSTLTEFTNLIHTIRNTLLQQARKASSQGGGGGGGRPLSPITDSSPFPTGSVTVVLFLLFL